MRYGFLITARCNASCAHCTTNSGPRETQAIPRERVLDLLNQAAEIWKAERAPDERLHVCISGGEPFTDFAGLVAVVAHGAQLGARMSCVSNGFWASSEARARERLSALKGAGLVVLAVSTSRFHQAFVKPERVQRALDVAKAVGIQTVLKCPVTAGDRRDLELEKWARACGADELEIFPVVPYLREGVRLAEDEYIRDEGLPEGSCPQPTVTVRETGIAYTCCMPGAFVDFLSLGNVYKSGLATVYRRFYRQAVQQTLRHRGPIEFARAIIAQGQGHRLRDRYESVCDLCAHIASDPRMSDIARESAQEFAETRFRSTLRQVAQREPA